MQNITAKTGEAHVTSDQFRSIIESIVGDGSYIANLDEQLEPELSTDNTLKIRSGVLIHHGHVMRVPPGTYDTVTYTNGSQGKKRIDLVVARYEKNSGDKTEPTDWVVIQGTPADSNPSTPKHTAGNMQDGDLTDDCPVFELHFDGINVTEVKKLVSVTESIDDLVKEIGTLNNSIETMNSDIAKLQTSAHNIQIGNVQVNTTHGSYGEVSVSFSKKFSKEPHVMVSLCTSNETTRNVFVYVKNVTTSGCKIGWYNTNTEDTGSDFSPYAYWLAIGD